MTKITDLLDQIDRLDQHATPGPWNHHDDNVVGYPYVENGFTKIPYIAQVVRNENDAPYIALARETLPQLANALRAVLDVLDDYTIPDKLHDPTGFAGDELESLEGYIREAIHTVLEGVDE